MVCGELFYNRFREAGVAGSNPVTPINEIVDLPFETIAKMLGHPLNNIHIEYI